MADPVSMGIFSILGGVVSTGMSMSAAQQEAAQTREMYNYQAAVADVNEKIAKQNADYARMAGEQEASRYGVKAAQRMGEITAGQAASGLRLDTGTGVDVRASQALSDRTDLAQIRSNAARAAYGHDVEAYNEQLKAEGYRKAAVNATKAGDLKAMTSLISGATSVSSKWFQGQQSGLWSGQTLGGTGYLDDNKWY